MKKREYALLDPGSRQDVIRAIAHDLGQLAPDKPWIVSVRRMQEPVSAGQMGLWWVWMGILGDCIGEPKDEAYATVKEHVEWLEGRGVSDLSAEEMHKLMEEVQRTAAMMGWSLPSSIDAYYQGIATEDAERGRRVAVP